MSDAGDAGEAAHPLVVFLDMAKQFAAVYSEEAAKLDSVPSAVSKLRNQVSVLTALCNQLLSSAGGAQDLPAEASSVAGDIQDDLKRCMEELNGWLARERGKRKWERVLGAARQLGGEYVPAAAVYLAVSDYGVHIAVLLVLLLGTVAVAVPSVFARMVRACAEPDLSGLDDLREDMREHCKQLRALLRVKAHAREERRYDVSKSVLDAEARDFWCTQFGAERHEVATDRLIETLLFCCPHALPRAKCKEQWRAAVYALLRR